MVGPQGAKAIVVAVTGFDRDGRLDLDGYRRHLARLASFGPDLCVAGSGTEEGHVLSDAERRDVVAVARDVCQEAGVGLRLNCREPRQAGAIRAEIELARELGCAALHVPILDVGHGYQPSAGELRRYLSEAISDALVPIVLSTSIVMHQVFPIDLTRFAVGELGVQGVVCAPPSLTYLAELIDTCGSEAGVFMAGAPHLINGLSLGAAGFLSPEGNIAPEACRIVADGWNDGRLDDVRRGLRLLLELSARLSGYGPAIGIKAGLRALDLADFGVRGPRNDVPKEQIDQLRPVLRQALLDAGLGAAT